MGIIKSLRSGFLGRQGERKIAGKIEFQTLLGYQGKLLRNIYVPSKDDETTEIDLLFITQKGVFVIESKNYSGYIFGNERYAKWTETLYGGKNFWGKTIVEKHQFYNPIWQNNTHIKYLKQYLSDDDIPFFSVVVFSDRCELKELSYDREKTIICYKHDISKGIRKIWSVFPDYLTLEEVYDIYETLSPLTNPNIEIKKKHVEDIKKKFEDTDICPLCGGKLVLRTAKNGVHAGQHFYGCSNYPKCKYIRR